MVAFLARVVTLLLAPTAFLADVRSALPVQCQHAVECKTTVHRL
jgi:hypothetical protein